MHSSYLSASLAAGSYPNAGAVESQSNAARKQIRIGVDRCDMATRLPDKRTDANALARALSKLFGRIQ
jgi:hypothetical protein